MNLSRAFSCLALATFLSTAVLLPLPEEGGAAGALDLLEVELADEREERKRGLMYRRELCSDCGMLFVFPRPRILSFWMKDTYIPLDIFFLDEEGRIVSLAENTVPLREMPIYTSTGPAKYALEVQGGYAREKGLRAGDRINIGALLQKAVDYRWPAGGGRGSPLP
jgi:hypothetical protein